MKGAPLFSNAPVARLHRKYTIVFKSLLGKKSCDVIELNVLLDHIHMIVMVPPKVSISDLMGIIKGRTAIRIFKNFPYLKQKPYWGNHFRAPGYCVDTVGLDAEMIRKYVKYQEDKERREEQKKFKFS